ncbi:hypothetical protein JL721_5519 [Aureococcus anophagefferens]|nr:hypothetical protein JL721_5519 [Aureococcus anophagefferens]
MHACDRDELLEQARQELDDVQAPLLAQMARASGPEFPWLLAASGRDDDAVRHAEQCCARAGLLRAPADRLGAALGAAWLVSARLRRGEVASACPLLLAAMRGLQAAPGPQHAFVGALMAEGAAAKFDASAVGERDATTRPLLNVARNVWDARQGNRSRATDDGAGAAWWPFRTPPPGRGVDADDRVLGEGGDGKPGPLAAAALALGCGRRRAALRQRALLERIARGRELRAAYDAAIASTCAEERVVYVGVGSGLELAACCAAAAPPPSSRRFGARRTSWPPASPGASRGEGWASPTTTTTPASPSTSSPRPRRPRRAPTARARARAAVVDPDFVGGALVNRRLVFALRALRRAGLVDEDHVTIPPKLRLCALVLLKGSRPVDCGDDEPITLDAFDAAVRAGFDDGGGARRAAERDLGPAFDAGAVAFASAATVVFELDDLALASGRGRATLAFAGDFDAARDYAVVCWPEAGFERFLAEPNFDAGGPFPHAWQLLPRGGDVTTIEAAWDGAAVRFAPRRAPAAPARASPPLVVPAWHAAMVRDGPRNAAFREAIARVVPAAVIRAHAQRRRALVVDYGAGTGLLSLMAAKAARSATPDIAAPRILGVEKDADLAAVAERVILDNGERVEVVVGDAGELGAGLPLDERADALLVEMFDCGGLGERVLHFVGQAWRHALRPDAEVVPRRCAVRACLVALADDDAAAPWLPYGHDPGSCVYRPETVVEGGAWVALTAPATVLKARNAARVRELLHAAGTPSPRMLPTADAIFALARDPDLERVAFEDAAALASALVRAGAAWPAFPKGRLAPGAGNDANPCACF